MPYIKQKDREQFDTLIKHMHCKHPGELNYVFTKIIIKYLKDKGTSYQAINDVIGSLQGANFEFYRRFVAKYEDIKIQENGDV